MPAERYNHDSFRREMLKGDLHFRGGPDPGQPAPDFELLTINGRRFRLSTLRGQQPVLIEFGSGT